MNASCRPLVESITAFVAETLGDLERTHLPGFAMPAFFGGHAQSPNALTMATATLADLHALGVPRVGRMALVPAMTAMLRQLDGPSLVTFGAFQLGETLREFGSFESNLLLADMTAAQKTNLAAGVDSSSFWPTALTWNRNYHGVIARCEWECRQLGLPHRPEMLEGGLAHVRAAFRKNPRGFFDDSLESRPRFDIYSADVLLFLEPLWDAFAPRAEIHRWLDAHTRFMEHGILDNGATFGWGRSIGALSVALTLEIASISLREGTGEDPRRILALAEFAFHRLKPWFRQGLAESHRHRQQDAYRGPSGLLAHTLDLLRKLSWSARRLSEVPEDRDLKPHRTFPHRDELVELDDKGQAVWLHRNETWSFQLPLTHHWAPSAYAPFFQSPGRLDFIPHRPLVSGAPRFLYEDGEWFSDGTPTRVEKGPHELTVTWSSVTSSNEHRALRTRPMSRTARFRVDGMTVFVEECWSFPPDQPLPRAIQLDFLESPRGFTLNPGPDAPGTCTVLDVTGLDGYQSVWGPISAVHQWQIPVLPAIQFGYTLTLHPQTREE